MDSEIAIKVGRNNEKSNILCTIYHGLWFL